MKIALGADHAGFALKELIKAHVAARGPGNVTDAKLRPLARL